MAVHHHHVFQFDDNDKPIYFDGILLHGHDDADHWDGPTFYRLHAPFGGYIDDGDCQDADSGFDCPARLLHAAWAPTPVVDLRADARRTEEE